MLAVILFHKECIGVQLKLYLTVIWSTILEEWVIELFLLFLESAEDMIAERENFKYNDLNKDGDFTREEIIKWVAPNLDQVSIDEADHLIQATDKNGDGFLSKDEIVEEHELWVGSEATDYGEFLRDEL